MKIVKTKFSHLFIIKSKVYYYNRNFLSRITLKKNFCFKYKFTLRSSRFKKKRFKFTFSKDKFPQGKYLTVLKGEILDIAVDLRINSKTFGKHFKINLSEKNGKSIFIPPGFAHGFVGLKKENTIVYF